MKIWWKLFALCLGLLITAPSFSLVSTQVRAEVTSITPLDFPYVRLGLGSVRAADESLVGSTINVTPVYSLKPGGAVDFLDRATVDNLEAFYLKPGDKIEATLLDKKKPDGDFYITRIIRVATDAELPVQPSSGVRTDKQDYSLGETVRITFIVQNSTRQNMTLQFPSGRMYDIWVEKDNKEIWRWSHGKSFTQAFTTLTLKPGERRTFSEVWDQTADNGEQVSPGAYSIFAQLMTAQPGPTPVRAQITIGTGKAVVKTVTIDSIVSNLDTALGQTVQISGTYLGWRPDPDDPLCKQGPPVTRSDWAISDQTGCIYVTGKSGLDPTDDYGKNITISGTVRKSSKGQPYIEVQTVILNQPEGQ